MSVEESKVVLLPKEFYDKLRDPEAAKRKKEIQTLAAIHGPRLRARMHNSLVKHLQTKEKLRRMALLDLEASMFHKRFVFKTEVEFNPKLSPAYKS